MKDIRIRYQDGSPTNSVHLCPLGKAGGEAVESRPALRFPLKAPGLPYVQ